MRPATPRSQTGATLWITAQRQVGGSLFYCAADRGSHLHPRIQCPQLRPAAGVGLNGQLRIVGVMGPDGAGVIRRYEPRW
jgi:hypothetical protein